MFIFLFSVVGTFLVSSNKFELYGFLLWVIGNVLAVLFFYNKKMFIMTLQFFIYLLLAIYGIIVRIS
jgi:nicotinamide riboside transporter PnuC